MSSINAYLYLNNNRNAKDISIDNLFKIQHFENSCNRARTEVGLPYGDTRAATLNITIKNAYDIREFYRRLKSQEPFEYDIYTGATFNKDILVASQCTLLKVQGYIVDIAEAYQYSIANTENEAASTITVQILIASMSTIYPNGKVKTLNITK